jgi:hypothetical protein
MSARIVDASHEPVTREYRKDMQLHLYRRDHIADLQFRFLIPLCQENAMHPARHSRDMVAINQLPGQRLDRCASCDVAARRERRAAKQKASS